MATTRSPDSSVGVSITLNIIIKFDVANNIGGQ